MHEYSMLPLTYITKSLHIDSQYNSESVGVRFFDTYDTSACAIRTGTTVLGRHHTKNDNNNNNKNRTHT